MRMRISRFVQISAAIVLLVGLIGWLAPFYTSSFCPYIERPNSQPHGIAIDKGGNIYCGSKFYGRIQKYSANGKFLHGYDTHGGVGWGTDFDFYLTETNNICVRISGLARSGKGSLQKITVYDSEGKVVEHKEYISPESNYHHPVKNWISDEDNNIYNFKGFLFPRVVKNLRNGNESLVIITPIWLWFFQSPFPAFAFFFISMFLLIFLNQDAALLNVVKDYLQQKGRFLRIGIYVVISFILVLLIFCAIFLELKYQ